MMDLVGEEQTSDSLQNPYMVERLDLFYGRDDVFDWLTEQLLEDSAGPNVPLVLYGPRRSGKTAVVEQLLAGRLGDAVLPLALDFSQLDLANQLSTLKQWLKWLIVRCQQYFAEQGLELPQIDDSLSIDELQVSFRRELMGPIRAFLGERKFLLVIDHTDRLLDYPVFLSFLTYWQEFLYQDSRIGILLLLERAPTAYVDRLPLRTTAYELGPFTTADSHRFLREPVTYFLSSDVLDYICHVTGRHPANLKLVAGGLFDRWQRYPLRQITVSDVIAVARSTYLDGQPMVEPGVRWPNPTARQRVRRTVRRNRFVAAGISIGVMLTLAGFAIILYMLWGDQLTTFSLVRSNAAATATAVRERLDAVVLTPGPTVPLDVLADVPEIELPELSPTLTSVVPTDAPTASPTIVPETPTAEATATVTPLAVIESTVEVSPSPTATAEVTRLVRTIDNMPMVLIPAAVFARGSRADSALADVDEQPLRDVTLDRFWIDQYEVSMAQYAGFLNAIGDHREGCGGVECARVSPDVSGTYLIENRERSEPYLAQSAFVDFPVNHVTWFGARDYCLYVGGRLPTEAEWEFAARGDDERLFPWGNAPPDRSRAVFATEFSRLLTVDALADGASPFGALGMAGSMWEWVNDWYDAEYYSWGPDNNPPGPPTGTERVTRGGSWAADSDAQRIRSANRNRFRPAAARADVGFRCVYDDDPS